MNTEADDRYTLDAKTRQYVYRNLQVTLTHKEFSLASVFFSNKNIVLSRSQLLTAVWGVSANLHTRRVDTHVSRLRTKLNLSESPWQITSIYNRGYCLHDSPGDELRFPLTATPAINADSSPQS